MDANGQHFRLLGDATHWPRRQGLSWDAEHRLLRLASQRRLQPPLSPAEALAQANLALQEVPRAIDAAGSVACWVASAQEVRVSGPTLPTPALRLRLDSAPTDLCLSPDGVLYVALGGAIHLHDLRRRFDDVRLPTPDFVAWRLAPAAEGGVWALERPSGRLARLHGRPLRRQTPLPEDYAPGVFRPVPENGNPPALDLVAPALSGIAPGEAPVALAASPQGALALLSWRTDNGAARLRRWDGPRRRWGPPLRLAGVDGAYALTWVEADRVALRVPGRREAPAFELGLDTLEPAAGLEPPEPPEPPEGRWPLGDVYPLAANAVAAPFANGCAWPAHYPVDAPLTESELPPEAAADERVLRLAEPLLRLSWRQLSRHGEALTFGGGAQGRSQHLIDSGSGSTVWHRLYAEAALPMRTAMVVWLAATAEPVAPELAWQHWTPHLFGLDARQLAPHAALPQAPAAAWDPAASELPGHPGLLCGERQRDQRGLFSVLVQDCRTQSRRLVGRYLWVRVEFFGDGRATPELAALRIWSSRFAYAEHYLPRLYRETVFGPPARQPGPRLGSVLREPSPAVLAALDAGQLPADPALAYPWASEGAMLQTEAPGQLWLLRDAGQAWRLRLEPDPAGSAATVLGLYRVQATPADFLERTLANFEGWLTVLEDRVAAAHLHTDPAVCGEGHLDWLASWVGVAFDPVLPDGRRRDWLRAAPQLAQWHGSARGLRLALDIASGGGVRSGEILVVEAFRLRRVMATLLGAQLRDEADPLLPGLNVNSHSVVGDALILGDAARSELLALFDASVGNDGEDAAVLAFDDKLAHRVLVLVHQEVQPQDFGLLRRMVELEAPAHVDVQVTRATWPLMVGISSLVGVDTYLGPPNPVEPVRVDQSILGRGGQVQSAPLLDPRLSGALLDTADAGSASPWRWLPDDT